MDFNYSPKEEAFREEIRQWLSENTKELPKWYANPNVAGPESDSEEMHQFTLWWHRKLYDAGYVGLPWPKEYGGHGATVMEQVVFNEELARHRAPGPTNVIGIGWCGPTIMGAGTDYQKERFLKKILTAEEIWCQGFSEPGAGSDLAGIQTRAVKDGDDYIINGQKVWTSGARWADWAILLTKTDPDAPRHRGMSYFLLDMHAPGVTVRPLRQITGGADFNEMFLDDVRISKDLMVGEENKGWYVAMATLDHERSGSGAAIARENNLTDIIRMTKNTIRNGQPLTKDPLFRQKLAQFYIELNVSKYLGLRNLTTQLRGNRPGVEATVGHVLQVESGQRLADFQTQIIGPYCQLLKDSKYAVNQGRWAQGFLGARGSSIGTGTTEIQKNVIAVRGLGLPRSY